MNENKLLILILVLILSTPLAFALNVTSFNGVDVEITPEFCSDEVAGMDVLGSDFYLYCEGNFEEEYYDVPKEILDEYRLSNLTELNDETEEIIFEEVPLISDESISPLEKPFDDWIYYLSIFGVILLLVFVVLIIARTVIKKKDERAKIVNLTPYLQNLRAQGYTDDQIEGLFIKQGYSSSFINKLFGKNH